MDRGRIAIKGGWLHGGLHPSEVSRFVETLRTVYGVAANEVNPNLDPLVKEYRRQYVRRFFMDTSLVSRAQFMSWFWQTTGSRRNPQAEIDKDFWRWYEHHEGGSADGPITGVTLAEARMFAWSHGGRLPSEAEFEWAIRGPQESGFINDLDSSHSHCRFGDAQELVEGAFNLPCEIPKRDRNKWATKLEGTAMAKPLCSSQKVLHTALRQSYEPPYTRNSGGRIDGRFLQLGAPGFRCAYDT